MTTRTFTVTVANPGSGNRYYIDGVLQDTLTLAEGGTYVFDWSAATSHPFRFSTTSDGTHSGGSEYTTGVTKDDGNYLTTITVATSAPTLYYYCQYHPNMGGQINTEAGDTWGLLFWGKGAWSDQNNTSISVTGVASTTSVGSVTIDAEINTGWGRNSWGLLNWGQAIGGAEVSVTGVSSTTSAGSVTATGLVELGWGRGSWGNRVWGDTFSALPSGVAVTSAIGTPAITTDVVVTVTGVQASITNDDVTVTTSVTIAQAGLALTSSTGTVDFDGDATTGTTGVAMTSAVGTAIVAPITLVDVTGVATTSSVGTVVLEITGSVNVTGVAATSAVGSIVTESIYSVTGVSVTSSAGNPQEVTGEGVIDDVTGVVLTSNVGSVIIIAWNEVDTGTPVTWTEIITAA